MVQNNKVLTVSYGTFSCTLEGFDDSFETMKAIAEYFRDLAADDRYFGSEPPQLDAEMLARIAQRDQARRIEAHRQDDGVVLRATDAPASEAPQPHPDRPESRANVTVASTHRTGHPNHMPEDDGEAPEDLSAPELAVLNPLPETEPEYEEDTPSAPMASAPQPAPRVEAEPVAEQPSPAADSIAAKLQRIRAVVSRADENAAQYDEDADDGMTPQDEPIDAISAAFAAQPTVEPEAAPTPEAPQELQPTEEEPVQAAAEDSAGNEETTQQPQPDPELVADILAPESEAETDTENTVVPEPEISDGEEDDTLTNLLNDGDEAAKSDPDTEEPEQLVDEPETGTPPKDKHGAQLSQGTLTAEDEVNLLNKLAQVEAELFARKDDRRELAQEDDLSRLMDAADARMDDPSSDDNRQTYSHLRTAVAATAAERTVSSKVEPDTSDEEYREDLASVVSPRRPAAQTKSARPSSDTIAPLRLVAEQRVDIKEEAEQEKERAPVQPRRVSSESETRGVSTAGGFARFAEEQGAHSLPELLEAAAAYLSFVEGQEQFSRPQLMNKVRALQLEHFDREESLRSFGQLLRDGKIEKAGGGRFSASSDIGFRPGGKRAAG